MSRKVEVRLKKDTDAGEDTTVGDRAYILHETAKGVAKAVVGVMGAYFLFRTMSSVTESAVDEYRGVLNDRRYEARSKRLDEAGN